MKRWILFFWLLLGLLLNLEARAQNWALSSVQVSEAKKWISKSRPWVIAVIDTGLDSRQPQLHEALWRNPGETGLDAQGRDKATNGIDDDGNGLVDDVSGWNFADDTNDFRDRHGHGTHVAGLIAARPGDLAGGVAPGVQLMVLKYYDPQRSALENLKALVRAIDYATRMNADIINYSGGGPVPNDEEKEAIRRAGDKGILFVAAAGNESTDSDRVPFYPADYGFSNIVSVGAHDARGQLIPASNFGARSVDLAAPGWEVVSTLPGARTGALSGTSQATAFVSAAAALLLTQRPDLQRDPAAIARRLRGTAQFEGSLANRLKSGGRLDLSRLLQIQERGRTFSGHRIRDLSSDVEQRAPAARREATFPLE